MTYKHIKEKLNLRDIRDLSYDIDKNIIYNYAEIKPYFDKVEQEIYFIDTIDFSDNRTGKGFSDRILFDLDLKKEIREVRAIHKLRYQIKVREDNIKKIQLHLLNKYGKHLTSEERLLYYINNK